MKVSRLTISFFLLVSIIGCSGKRQLSRDGLPLEVKPILSVTSVGPLGDTLSGRLNLLYEKALRGSVDSRIWVGEKYIAFNTTRRRFLILKRETGEKLYQIKTRKGFVFGPAISDSILILIRRSPFGQVGAINLYSGKTIAQRKINEIRTEPIIVEGRLILGTKTGVIALDPVKLETVWKYRSEEEVNLIPTAGGQIIYAVCGAREVVALAVGDGKQLWKYKTASDIVCPLEDGRFIYINTVNGQLTALDKGTGVPVWTFKTAFPGRGGVVEADDRLYFGTSEGKVFCLSTVDGSEKWEFQTKGVIASRPVVLNRIVIIGGEDRYLYSLDSDSGRLLDKRTLEGPVTRAVTVWGNRVYAACRNNRLYCFEVN